MGVVETTIFTAFASRLFQRNGRQSFSKLAYLATGYVEPRVTCGLEITSFFILKVFPN
jgi:hypothetical protein